MNEYDFDRSHANIVPCFRGRGFIESSPATRGEVAKPAKTPGDPHLPKSTSAFAQPQQKPEKLKADEDGSGTKSRSKLCHSERTHPPHALREKNNTSDIFQRPHVVRHSSEPAQSVRPSASNPSVLSCLMRKAPGRSGATRKCSCARPAPFWEAERRRNGGVGEDW